MNETKMTDSVYRAPELCRTDASSEPRGSHIIKKIAMVLAAAMAVIGAPSAAAAPAAGHSLAPDGSVVFGFSDFAPHGSSQLNREANGLTMSLATTALKPRDAVTVWWVVFNHPENCRAKLDNPSFPFRCGETDLWRAGVQASVLYAAGHVIDGDGDAGFGAHLAVGDTTGALFGPGLEPSQLEVADVHLVVHDHGPAEPSLMPAQIHSFGVCSTVCTDVQASVHETANP
jgi:hypothetical protein